VAVSAGEIGLVGYGVDSAEVSAQTTSEERKFE
jgi:hypothetical protein